MFLSIKANSFIDTNLRAAADLILSEVKEVAKAPVVIKQPELQRKLMELVFGDYRNSKDDYLVSMVKSNPELLLMEFRTTYLMEGGACHIAEIGLGDWLIIPAKKFAEISIAEIFEGAESLHNEYSTAEEDEEDEEDDSALEEVEEDDEEDDEEEVEEDDEEEDEDDIDFEGDDEEDDEEDDEDEEDFSDLSEIDGIDDLFSDEEDEEDEDEEDEEDEPAPAKKPSRKNKTVKAAPAKSNKKPAKSAKITRRNSAPTKPANKKQGNKINRRK